MTVVETRRDIAREICRCLDHMLLAWETCEPICNPERDDCLITEVRKLQRTYRLADPDTTTNLLLTRNDADFDLTFTTGLLPAEGRRLWRRLEGMIYPESLGATGAAVNLYELTQVVEDFRAWLEAWYSLADTSSGHDPGAWDRRIQFDEPSLSVTLDGVCRQVEKVENFKLIRELVNAAKTDKWYVTRHTLASKVDYESEKSIDRLIDELPMPWKEYVRIAKPKGVYIILPGPNGVIRPPAG
jgi:hypothetical protein